MIPEFPFDLKLLPFTRSGAYHTFWHVTRADFAPEALYLRNLRGADAAKKREVFRVDLVEDGKSVPPTEHPSPTLLTLQSATGHAEICLPSNERIHVRGRRAGFRLTKTADRVVYDFCQRRGPGDYELNLYSNRIKYRLRVVSGVVTFVGDWKVTQHDGLEITVSPQSGQSDYEFFLDEYETTYVPRTPDRSFDDDLALVKTEWAAQQGLVARVPRELQEGYRLSQYVHWANVVSPSGHIKQAQLFDSKNWMPWVWGWSNCLEAMALCRTSPHLAWNELTALYGQQDEQGLLPDCYCDKNVIWNFTKPPIDGWALRWMRRRSPWITKGHLADLYPRLARWTQWWLTHQDDDGDGVPQYSHGNDSGWDNATVFALGPGVESPDLAAYLIVQLDVLAELARELGHFDESARWTMASDTLLHQLLEHSWNGKRFTAPVSGSHTQAPGDSLIRFVPLILGNKIPQSVRTAMVAELRREGHFLTDFGLATENLNSDLFEEDGYWRGAMWASSTMIVLDGLRESGADDLADKVAQRYLAADRVGGSAENFSALDGHGLRDRAYTWTSSVFKILCEEALFKETPHAQV